MRASLVMPGVTLGRGSSEPVAATVLHHRATIAYLRGQLDPAATDWQQALAIAQDELEGKSEVREETIRYYMNPALTSDRNACRFKKEFVPVVEAGRHQFFREPTEFERADLKNSNPIECQRYQAALEAKKRLAKAFAERKSSSHGRGLSIFRRDKHIAQPHFGESLDVNRAVQAIRDLFAELVDSVQRVEHGGHHGHGTQPRIVQRASS